MIAANKQDMQRIQKALRKSALLLGPAKMKRLMQSLGVLVQSNTLENIRKDRTIDGSKMPALKPSTIKRKRKTGHGKKLKWDGQLQKLNIKSGSDEVRITSAGYKDGYSYATYLNEVRKNPFKFMGFGKKLVNEIMAEIKKRTWKLVFK